MIAALLWLILFVLSWPIALLALLLLPLLWLLLLPFRLLGFTVSGVLDAIKGLVTLPMRVFRRREARG